MPKNTLLKKAAMGLGLSVAVLCPAFNSVAQTVQPQKNSVTAPSQKSTFTKAATPANDNAKDAEMARTFGEINAYLTAHTIPDYAVESDQTLQRKIDHILALLQNGADAGFMPEGGLTLPGSSNLGAFEAAIILAERAHRPDLVAEFIRYGAPLRHVAPDGWTPMDYALIAFQEAQSDNNETQSMRSVECAARVLRLLHDAGLTPRDAHIIMQLSGQNQTPQTQNGKVNDFTAHAVNVAGLQALLDNGLITQDQFNGAIDGPPALAQAIDRTTSITDSLIQAYGGKLVKAFPDAIPGGPEPIIVKNGESLLHLARRFERIMHTNSEDAALHRIAALNNITLRHENWDRPLPNGTKILIPVTPDVQIGTIRAGADETLLMLAYRLRPVYYNQHLSIRQIARDIARTNGISQTRIEDHGILTPGQELTVGYVNDTYSLFSSLTPPAQYDHSRRVDLIVVEDDGPNAETQENPHEKRTLRTAAATAYGINKVVDFLRFHLLDTMLLDYPNADIGQFFRMLMDAGDSPVRDRVVLSHSMVFKDTGKQRDINRELRGGDSVAFENIRLMLNRVEKAMPTLFTAAGNFWPDGGKYIQSFLLTHSPHTVIIGAAGHYDVPPGENDENALVISPYSSYGADVCAPLPSAIGEQMEGTSFATPLTAALYRQFAEWYGDRLSFEEIMAAGMMSADREVWDYDSPEKRLAVWDGKAPWSLDAFEAHRATYRTNGGGLPHQERCGAGVINVAHWQQALNLMLTLKAPGQDAQGHSFNISAGHAETRTGVDGKAEYIYRIAIPRDMTLGKLTILVPQQGGRHSPVTLRTPSGFSLVLPKSATDVVSTFAFAYEDVKAGEYIEIETAQPLASGAGLILRGNDKGNAIALLRDRLRAQGVLPAPLRKMVGDTDVGPLTDAPPVETVRNNVPNRNGPKPG